MLLIIGKMEFITGVYLFLAIVIELLFCVLVDSIYKMLVNLDIKTSPKPVTDSEPPFKLSSIKNK